MGSDKSTLSAVTHMVSLRVTTAGKHCLCRFTELVKTKEQVAALFLGAASMQGDGRVTSG